MKKFIIPILFFIRAGAQDYLGLQSSNYAGVTGAYSNPANIVDNRLRVDVTLFGLYLNVDNNFAGIKRSALTYTGSITNPKGLQFPSSWNDNNPSSPTFFRNNIVKQSNGTDKSVTASMRITLPSFMFAINKKNAIAFNWSVRNYVNIDGMSQNLSDLAYYNFNKFQNPAITDLIGTKLSNKNFKVEQMAWAEYGLTYAHVFIEDGKHFFKVGITPKLLQGFEAAYLNVSNLNYQVNPILTKTVTTPSGSTIVVPDTSSGLGFFQGNASYAHSDNMDNAINTFNNPNAFTNYSSYYKIKPSYGFGLDLGAVYEWRPDYEKYKYDMDGKTGLWRRDKNKYKLKFSFAVNDIGRIKYRKSPNSLDFNANVSGQQLALYAFKHTTSAHSFDSIINGFFKPPSSSNNSFYMYLPTSINTQVDYNIWHPFYLNFSANFSNIYSASTNNVHDFTNISLAPRIDYKWWGLTFPVSYNTLSGKHNDYYLVGTMLRAGPLVIGSNNLLGYFTGDVYGANFYFMLKVPIPYGYKKDSDGDKISDRKDACPNVFGVLEFKGCPDRDGDHVQDKDDKCPDVPGLKELNGCPDKDGDGITDLEDMCPDSAGTAEFKGCPDRDGDKIIDRKDACPDVAGLPQFNGCPDKDGDGIPDKDDACPDVAGTKEFKGCPDKDGDGIPDKDDACPDVFGPKEHKGCPDKDNDSVLDKDDACPDVAGPPENKGCPWPDSDHDGVIDKEDSCVNVPGEARFKGCPPPIKAAEKKIIEKAFASLEFATGNDIIKPKSFPSLNDLAKLLLKHAGEWQLKLSGHTDNQGDAEKNLELSEKRAKAVKNYLVKKGADPEQIATEWFGQTQPIADNKTPQGRQKNRRVEMKIIFKE